MEEEPKEHKKEEEETEEESREELSPRATPPLPPATPPPPPPPPHQTCSCQGCTEGGQPGGLVSEESQASPTASATPSPPPTSRHKGHRHAQVWMNPDQTPAPGIKRVQIANGSNPNLHQTHQEVLRQSQQAPHPGPPPSAPCTCGEYGCVPYNNGYYGVQQQQPMPSQLQPQQPECGCPDCAVLQQQQVQQQQPQPPQPPPPSYPQGPPPGYPGLTSGPAWIQPPPQGQMQQQQHPCPCPDCLSQQFGATSITQQPQPQQQQPQQQPPQPQMQAASFNGGPNYFYAYQVPLQQPGQQPPQPPQVQFQQPQVQQQQQQDLKLQQQQQQQLQLQRQLQQQQRVRQAQAVRHPQLAELMLMGEARLKQKFSGISGTLPQINHILTWLWYCFPCRILPAKCGICCS